MAGLLCLERNHEDIGQSTALLLSSTEREGYPPETADEPDAGPAGDEAVAEAPTHHSGSNGPGCTLDISASLHALVPVSGVRSRANGIPTVSRYLKNNTKVFCRVLLYCSLFLILMYYFQSIILWFTARLRGSLAHVRLEVSRHVD